mmetsp:Transcript_9943/g.31562  ORF Transcript_9943/g.31562 Transcript_9943/m.31562 type:complete len:250 (-) Transcript_9943:88-837(-)
MARLRRLRGPAARGPACRPAGGAPGPGARLPGRGPRPQGHAVQPREGRGAGKHRLGARPPGAGLGDGGPRLAALGVPLRARAAGGAAGGLRAASGGCGSGLGRTGGGKEGPGPRVGAADRGEHGQAGRGRGRRRAALGRAPHGERHGQPVQRGVPKPAERSDRHEHARRADVRLPQHARDHRPRRGAERELRAREARAKGMWHLTVGYATRARGISGSLLASPVPSALCSTAFMRGSSVLEGIVFHWLV